MVDLTVDELDVLHRIEEKVELQPFFFKKVKGLKWFNELSERGYFKSENIPKPVPAKEKGYISVPYWPAIEFLVKSSAELEADENNDYAVKFLEVLKNVTKYAVDNDISNYRTWWQFSEIIQNIPTNIITLDDLEIVAYWLDDKFERGLVAQKIGEQWVSHLLEANDNHCLQLALKLLTYLFKVVFNEQKYGETVRRESSLRFDYYHAEKITKKVATLAGIKLGREAIEIFDGQLKYVLNELKNDSWSSLWQPAIEEHEQNKYKDNAENILVTAYRDSLSGYISSQRGEACDYIKSMLASDFNTIHRIAIYTLNENYLMCSDLLDTLLDDCYLESNYRHEMWHLFNRNYLHFEQTQKDKLLELISHIIRKDDDDNIHEGATAYNKAIWLAAIKDHGLEETKLYDENVAIVKTEPEHPDFSSYMSTGWGGHESSISFKELQILSIDELVKELNSIKDAEGASERSIEGLAKTFKQVIKTTPLSYYDQLNKFTELDFAFIYEIIEAFRDIWAEKTQLPWDDIWSVLFEFCSTIIGQDRFWSPESTTQRKHFVANRYWIVSSIGRLLEAGTKSDDHAFSEEYLNDAEAIIAFILEREEGSEYKLDSDAVSISINSPRGHCLEALINLTLRSCRLSDKTNNKDHSEVWSHFQHYFDTELGRADTDNPEYEFASLITNYLPNFLYMSTDWVTKNLSRIFDQSNYLKWLCAMQGYVYVGTIYQEIYQYLKVHGDFLKALDDENINKKVEEKVIQNIVIAYINNFESSGEDNSLIDILISRNKSKEISYLIWFIWTLRKKGDENIKNKVYVLWPKILKNIDLATIDGKKIASKLCDWSAYVNHVDDERRELLLAVSPYADEDYNSYQLLESIADISQTQPFEAHIIWMRMLEESSSDFPEEAIRKILSNLVLQGKEGSRKAKEIVSAYLNRGNDNPLNWLTEIKLAAQDVGV